MAKRCKTDVEGFYFHRFPILRLDVVRETIDLKRSPTTPTPRLSLEKRSGSLAMDLPRQPQSDPLETIRVSTLGMPPVVMGPKLTSENADRSGPGPIPNDISDR